MNKSRRMQMKAILCLAGIALLLLIAIAGTARYVAVREQEQEHVPVVVTMENVWVTEVTEAGIRLFDGRTWEYPWAQETAQPVDRGAREQIADVTLTDGYVTDIKIKDAEKVSGKVVSVLSGKGVELEGRGILEFAPQMKMYRLYGGMAEAGEKDIRIGYNFCDFVMENGKICAVLVTRDEAMEYIRVQIKSSDYASSKHEHVTVTVDTDFVVRYGVGEEMTEEFHQAGEELTFRPDSGYFTSDRVYIVPEALTGRIKMLSVNRSQGTPSYRGVIELIRLQGETEGIYVVNEVLLEEYLYAVVPSEMPSGYPAEALKAQAICARTYAYRRMINPSNKAIGAHVDDSASYQVYNNILEQDTTTAAVRDTSGQILFAGQEAADTYYYSTSCGFGTESDIWKGGTGEKLPYLKARRIGTKEDASYTAESMMEDTVFAEFIGSTFESDFEARENWYRWTYTVEKLDKERMLRNLQSRYAANEKLILTEDENGAFVSMPVEKLGEIRDIYVSLRNEGGVADEMLIETESDTIKVITEHNIRYVLCDGVTKVKRQDGSQVEMATLLPSAFFVITTGKEGENVVGYTLTGGGFGHGVGMSQNGARAMAAKGFTARDILTFFYEDSRVEQIY